MFIAAFESKSGQEVTIPHNRLNRETKDISGLVKQWVSGVVGHFSKHFTTKLRSINDQGPLTAKPARVTDNWWSAQRHFRI